MNGLAITRKTCARIPTDGGEFTLCLYHNNQDDKENLALIAGDVAGRENVLVRLHSECFTGDVLGSRRCDCGPQLAEAMRQVAEEGAGVILYLRQEGRGIGLLEKLRAYNLQDMGYDTVDANLMLGHQADLRDYGVAALILRDLGVSSLRLLTNNPDKIASLEKYGLRVTERVPLQIGLTAENAAYLNTKVRRMRHLLDLGPDASLHPSADVLPAPPAAPQGTSNGHAYTFGLRPDTLSPQETAGRPFVTLSYAQSLDGSIAAHAGERTYISGPEALQLTHRLRAQHDAILVGIGTVLTDNPQLTVRYAEGPNPQPVIVDSRLRFPLDARLLTGPRPPWIMTAESADVGRQRALEAAGARIVRFATTEEGRVALQPVLDYLARQGVAGLMVEGGAGMIRSFLEGHLADRLVLTIAPMMLGGVPAISQDPEHGGREMPRLQRAQTLTLGRDVILIGDLAWG